MVEFLRANLDYWIVAAASLVALAGASVWLHRRNAARGRQLPVAWLVIILTLVAGYAAVTRTDSDERSNLRRMLQGFAFTYAAELERCGHAKITFDTNPDDPLYLSLIDAQKRWLAANSEVADVYTMRQRADGKFAFVVDSETDYDDDDDFVDEREQRTQIGETLDDEDGMLQTAWNGEPSFSDTPHTDRWGTWVSATVPMRDETGRVEAICGVDYPAAIWAEHLSAARWGVLGFLAAFVAVIEAVAVMLCLLRAHVCELEQQVIARERTAAALADAKEQAEAANVAKSAFLANMSHELRTPLTAVLGFADLLRTSDLTPQQRTEWTATISRNGRHLLNVINDVLDLSKIEAGKMNIATAPTSPSGLLDEVVATMRVRAAGKSLALRAIGQESLPPRVMLDEQRVRQILVNLLSNAIKFTPAGSVTIDASWHDKDADGGVLRFEVADTGIGMSQRVLDNLFKPFEQGDTSAARQFGGTGLGLTISQRLARLMGGEIRVRSIEGVGSTFTFELAAKLAAEAPPPRALLDAPVSIEGVRVLFVEDVAENQRLIAHHLTRAGAAVTIAENGSEALSLIAESAEPFDVVLMDMQMPVMDGYAATAELRRGGFDRPIVALTAHALAGDREKCLAAGCDDYAAKPIDPSLLIDLVRRHTTGAASPRRSA